MILVSITAYGTVYLLGKDVIVKFEIWGAVCGSLACFAVLAWLFYREYERVIRTRCLFQIDKHGCGG